MKNLPELTDELVGKIIPDPKKSHDDISTRRAAFYLQTYPAVLQIARNKTLDTETRLLQLACASYGWMPTIPKSVSLELNIDEIAAIQNHGAASKCIESLKTPIINNSWVGTSKMLHFINPSHFPIWDSRIATTLFGKHTNANNKKRYLEYCQKTQAWDLQMPGYGEPLANMIEAKYEYKPTNLRCIELVLFSMSA